MSVILNNQFGVGDYRVDRDLNTLTLIDPVTGEEKEQQVVEPKVIEVLYYLAARPNQVISRQQLMTHLWPSQVSDGAVSRVIGLLRKALGDNSEAPTYIQTIAKKGYRLIAVVTPLPEPMIAVVPSAKSTNPMWVAIFIATITFVILYGLFIGDDPSEARVSFALKNPQFVQLTSTPGFEYDPNLSEDELWLVYRHRQNTSQSYDLYLKQLDNQQTIQLTHSDHDDRSPTFSSNKQQLVFFRKGPNYCRLMRLTLNPDGIPKQEEEIYHCGAYDHYSNVVWSKDQRTLYFTDRASANVPYQIQQLNLATGRVTEITHGLDNYYGDNELAISPSGQYLAFFHNKFWGNNQVFTLDLKTGQQRKLVELGFLAWNISWTADNQHLLFSDNRAGGKLQLLNINDLSLETIYHIPQSIQAPELSHSGTRILYSSETADVDLWQQALVAGKLVGQASKLTSSSSKFDLQPVLTSDGKQVLFLSDRAGVMQLWLQQGLQQANGQLRVMDSVADGISIDNYHWDPVGEFAVVGLSNKQLVLLDTKNNRVKPLDLAGHNGAFGHFSLDGKTLYFSSDQSGDWQLWSYQLATKAMTQLTQTGGYQVRTSADPDVLYFTKYREDGIWRLRLSTGNQQQIVTDSQRSRPFVVCPDALLYISEQKDTVLWRHPFDQQTQPIKKPLLTLANNAKLRFDSDALCQTLVFSQWQNDESDVMMLGFDQ